MSSSKWKPYPEYKKTDIEWIPKIPTNWKVVSAKRIFQNSKQLNKGLQSLERLSLTMNGVIERPIDDATGLQPTEFETYQLFEKNDLVFKLIDLENIKTSRIGIVPKKGIMSPAYIRVLNNVKRNMRYYYFQYYDLYLRNILNDIGSAGVRSNISATQLLEFPIILPSNKEEENKISNFCDLIDSIYVKLKNSLNSYIRVLEERRSVFIIHAVTKGLNPDVSMRDSEVDWLGDIPSHWGIIPLKFFCMFQRGHDLPSDIRVKGSIPVVSSGGISGWHNRSKAKQPGIVTGRYGSIGVFHLIEQDYWPLNTSLYSTNFYNNNPKYVYFAMSVLSPLFHLESSKSAVPGVDRNDLFHYKITKPPYREQEQIADYIERRCSVIDKVIEETKLSIDKLKEYRTVLISAAVTGKIDVGSL